MNFVSGRVSEWAGSLPGEYFGSDICCWVNILGLTLSFWVNLLGQTQKLDPGVIV